MEEKHIINIKGTEFIKFSGLLDLAHKKGLKKIEIIDKNIDFENKTAYTIAIVYFENGTSFEGLGTATQENCNSMVSNHFGEMSHTRAIARALRVGLNVGATCYEELSGVVETEAREDSNTLRVEVPLVCSVCNKKISEAEKDYSIRWFNKTLCRSCQDKEKEKKDGGGM